MKKTPFAQIKATTKNSQYDRYFYQFVGKLKLSSDYFDTYFDMGADCVPKEAHGS